MFILWNETSGFVHALDGTKLLCSPSARKQAPPEGKPTASIGGCGYQWGNKDPPRGPHLREKKQSGVEDVNTSGNISIPPENKQAPFLRGNKASPLRENKHSLERKAGGPINAADTANVSEEGPMAAP